MKNPELNLECYHIYDKNINLRLFRDVVNFVLETTNLEDLSVVKERLKNVIWGWNTSKKSKIEQEYGFRYLGEMLERYEERIGRDLRDFRAIALAVGYTRPCITRRMIIGSQLQQFVSKIRNHADGDIYLQGALCLLGNKTASAQHEKLLDAEYIRTEDVLFVLSIASDLECAFLRVKQKLYRLLEKSRTIPAQQNSGVFSWLIGVAQPFLKTLKGKDAAILRALFCMTNTVVKKGGKPYQALIDGGYTHEEIVYLNLTVVLSRPVRETTDTLGIKAEKIAMQFLIAYLNSDQQHHENMYGLIKWVLVAYQRFRIKIGGKEGIWDAVKDEVCLVQPQTFLFLFRLLPDKHFEQVFRYDILNSKWDVLSTELSPEEYLELFDTQIERQNFALPHCQDMENAQLLEKWLERFQKLTNIVYEETFFKFSYNRQTAFSILVQYEAINLISFYEEVLQDHAQVRHLEDYVEGINTRKSFEFLQYLYHTYSQEQIDNVFGKNQCFFSELLKYSCYYHGNRRQIDIQLQRDFLSAEEHRQLYDWLDNYMFCNKPDQYFNFVVNSLENKFLQEIYTSEELRALYDILKKQKPELDNQNLRETYMTEQELAAYQAKQQEQQVKEKQAMEERKRQDILDEFNQLEGNFPHKICELIKKHSWWTDKIKIALGICLERMSEFQSTCKTVRDFSDGLYVLSYIIKYKLMDMDRVTSLILKLREGVLDDDEHDQPGTTNDFGN